VARDDRETWATKGEVGGLEAVRAGGAFYLTNGEFNAIRRFDPSQGTADTFKPDV